MYLDKSGLLLKENMLLDKSGLPTLRELESMLLDKSGFLTLREHAFRQQWFVNFERTWFLTRVVCFIERTCIWTRVVCLP